MVGAVRFTAERVAALSATEIAILYHGPRGATTGLAAFRNALPPGVRERLIATGVAHIVFGPADARGVPAVVFVKTDAPTRAAASDAPAAGVTYRI